MCADLSPFHNIKSHNKPHQDIHFYAVKRPHCRILRDKKDNYTASVFKCCFSAWTAAMNLSGHYSKKLCENADVLIRWTGH